MEKWVWLVMECREPVSAPLWFMTTGLYCFVLSNVYQQIVQRSSLFCVLSHLLSSMYITASTTVWHCCWLNLLALRHETGLYLSQDLSAVSAEFNSRISPFTLKQCVNSGGRNFFYFHLCIVLRTSTHVLCIAILPHVNIHSKYKVTTSSSSLRPSVRPSSSSLATS